MKTLPPCFLSHPSSLGFCLLPKYSALDLFVGFFPPLKHQYPQFQFHSLIFPEAAHLWFAPATTSVPPILNLRHPIRNAFLTSASGTFISMSLQLYFSNSTPAYLFVFSVLINETPLITFKI
jgi:hypothetical protein